MCSVPQLALAFAALVDACEVAAPKASTTMLAPRIDIRLISPFPIGLLGVERLLLAGQAAFALTKTQPLRFAFAGRIVTTACVVCVAPAGS